MTLYEKLQDKKAITSEEDVKDAYIKALGLTKYNKNLVDIQTKEIWFEAKEGYSHTTYEMFTQLLHYVKQATNEGEYVAPFLCVIDTRKAAIMRTEDAMFLINRKDIKWANRQVTIRRKHSMQFRNIWEPISYRLISRLMRQNSFR